VLVPHASPHTFSPVKQVVCAVHLRGGPRRQAEQAGARGPPTDRRAAWDIPRRISRECQPHNRQPAGGPAAAGGAGGAAAPAGGGGPRGHGSNAVHCGTAGRLSGGRRHRRRPRAACAAGGSAARAVGQAARRQPHAAGRRRRHTVAAVYCPQTRTASSRTKASGALLCPTS
jgi:hypothetical protein